MLTESTTITSFRHGLSRQGFQSHVYGMEQHLVVAVARRRPALRVEAVVGFRGRTQKQVDRAVLLALVQLRDTARAIVEMRQKP